MVKRNILVLETNVVERECLTLLLGAEPGFEIVGACHSGYYASRIVLDKEVDVVLADYRIPDSQLFFSLTKARQAGYSGHILLRASESGMEPAEQLAKLVDAAIFPPTLGTGPLIEAIRELSTFRKPSPDQRPAEQNDELAQWFSLTAREVHVLDLVLEGLANIEIAADLGVSEGSVKCSMQHLFRKTGVRTRSQLVKRTLEIQMASTQLDTGIHASASLLVT